MDVSSTSLQIPESPFAGPSRTQQGGSRPVSVQPTPPPSSQPSSRRQRASHTVVSSQQQQQQHADDQTGYRDVYSHPAAVAYAAAHPRRTIPKFGPYLLLQTLGEGEFGKVKLGLHSQWGEEVAVKLIRRGNIDSTLRMSKVEREIEVLRTLKHPNIVRLYDVIETDKYIGIILEYASGGELFDHILAHRYLKEKDAAKLFSQLVSGVWYIHQKKIVHRDLKLENLLLDRHRNVIITDFGFANRFEHRSDDLMQTSCGSPCYAAPELVISEGLYVGSAVDIWSCGVILYAMLAGYLPFDDDPANPDGDNINLLYKYIVNTPLSFPDYISPEARDLLSMMLVPDPTRRADLRSIMEHPWLGAWAHTFEKSVDDLESAAMEQHQLKRMAYQKQMKQAVAATTETNSKVSRTQSARPEGYAHGNTSSKRSQKDQPEYLYETSVDHSMYSTSSPPHSTTTGQSRRGATSAIVLPTTHQPAIDDDPFAPISSRPKHAPVSAPAETISQNDIRVEPGSKGIEENVPSSKSNTLSPTFAPAKSSPENGKKKTGGFRHTIQVEYGEAEAQDHPPVITQTPTRSSKKDPEETPSSRRSGERNGHARERSASQNGPSGSAQDKTRRPSVDTHRSVKPLPAAPTTPPPARPERVPPPPTVQPPAVLSPVHIAVTSPPATPQHIDEDKSSHIQSGTESSGSGSAKSRHRKGLSVDKLGLGKIFGGAPEHIANGTSSRVPSEGSVADHSIVSDVSSARSSRPLTLQTTPSPAHQNTSKSSLLSPGSSDSRKSGRNTLTVMVEPLSRGIKSRSKGKNTHPEIKEKVEQPIPEPKTAVQPQPPSAFPNANVSRTDIGVGIGMPASTSKARKVMQWFRSKSKSGGGYLTDDPSLLTDSGDAEKRATTPTQDAYRTKAAASSSTVNRAPSTTNGSDYRQVHAPGHPIRTASAGTDNSFSQRVKRTVGVVVPMPAKNVLRIHHGAVDQTTITTKPPPEVMKHVRDLMDEMGISFQLESEYKYRCVRPKKRKLAGVGLGLREAPGASNGLAAFTIHGSAASNGVDKRGLPVPSHPSFGATGGMLRGLLMRRQSSQVSTSGMGASQPSLHLEHDDTVIPADIESPVLITDPSSPIQESVYGDSTQDLGDEVRFTIELTRLDRLDDTYSLDIRRLKGNLRSYKFLYDTIRERADLQR